MFTEEEKRNLYISASEKISQWFSDFILESQYDETISVHVPDSSMDITINLKACDYDAGNAFVHFYGDKRRFYLSNYDGDNSGKQIIYYSDFLKDCKSPYGAPTVLIDKWECVKKLIVDKLLEIKIREEHLKNFKA